jgi:hypothetical protein
MSNQNFSRRKKRQENKENISRLEGEDINMESHYQTEIIPYNLYETLDYVVQGLKIKNVEIDK